MEEQDDLQAAELLSLAQAKKARQESEEQAKLLANRIALLRQEEAKANRKIEETRRKAREILEARTRNQEAQRRKEEERKAREHEEELKAESNRLAKEEARQSKEAVRTQLLQKIKDSVQTIKREKEAHQEAISERKLCEIEANTTRAQQMKDFSKDAKHRLAAFLDEKRQLARQQQLRRIEEELKIRREKEEEVARMEREEVELISRLQNTQLMQKTALEELENIATTNKDLSVSQILSLSTTPSKRPSSSRSPYKSQ